MAEASVETALNSTKGFQQWWSWRTLPNDRGIVLEAERRGLISRGVGLIFLTDAGKALRNGCI